MAFTDEGRGRRGNLGFPTIKELKKPKLGNVKMSCDCVIHKKLTEYPMTNDAWATNNFTVIVGKMGQGKTSLMTNLVKNVFNKCYENIYLFMPENSRTSIENDIFTKHLPEDQLFDTLSEEGLFDVYERLQESSKEKENSLLIIDDFQAQLKEKDILKVLQKIITKMRHLRCTIILLQQNFQALQKSLRELVSNLIVFDLGKSQLSKIFLEIVQMNKEQYEKLVKVAFVDPHDWILINFHRSKKVYKMFDEITFDDDEKINV
jgi:thymidine kinase